MEETGMAWLPICRAGRWLKKSQAFRGTVVHRHVLRMLDVACFAPRLCQFVSLSSFVDAFAEYDCYINRKSCPTYGAFLRRIIDWAEMDGSPSRYVGRTNGDGVTTERGNRLPSARQDVAV
jgi:hypothetical protein